MFDRIIRMIGKESFHDLQQARILIVGIGGVGGYALESLVRSGIKHITICDYDVIEESNINRQIIAHSNNIGKLKISEALKRMKEINPECEIVMNDRKLTPELLKDVFEYSFDFVIDACDDTILKSELICYAMDHGISIISCMGTGNRLHPEKFEIKQLDKTMNDPLAKKMRNLLRKKGGKYLEVMVVCSNEVPLKNNTLGTLCPVPMTAGALLSSYVLQKLLENKKHEGKEKDETKYL